LKAIFFILESAASARIEGNREPSPHCAAIETETRDNRRNIGNGIMTIVDGKRAVKSSLDDSKT
jgi:hypothetical protein